MVLVFAANVAWLMIMFRIQNAAMGMNLYREKITSSKFLKSELVWILVPQKLFDFQTVQFSDTFLIRMCLKSEIYVRISTPYVS